MEKRIDKFGIGLDEITAHTLKIIEILQQEKNMLKAKNRREMKQKLEQVKHE